MPHTLKEVLPSSARLRSDGHLEIGGADTVELAREFGTPLFVMCEQTFRERARRYREAYPDADVYYAGKAFLCVEMARMVAEEDLGLDVASGGELSTALKRTHTSTSRQDRKTRSSGCRSRAVLRSRRRSARATSPTSRSSGSTR